MLTFSEVDYSYSSTPLFSELNFHLDAGEFCFLIGRSGAGKSTLLKMIYMNIKPQSGYVQVGGYDSREIKNNDLPLLRRKLGVVFQDFRLLSDRTIYENLAFVLEVINTPRREIKKRVNDVLTDVGLSHRRKSMPDELSGGEKQRVAIARAVINDPFLIIADEPTGNLDPETSAEIIEILQRINKRGTSVLFATHNYEIVKRLNCRIAKLENGRIYKAVLKKAR